MSGVLIISVNSVLEVSISFFTRDSDKLSREEKFKNSMIVINKSSIVTNDKINLYLNDIFSFIYLLIVVFWINF